MTIDKIQSYMPKDIFDFWCNCKDIAKLNGAKVLLLSELRNGIYDLIENKYKYIAEYYMLCHLAGTEREDINSQK